jgi:NAD+ kinase
VTPSLTFENLRDDACLIWQLPAAKTLLVDAVAGKIWPRAGKVEEATRASKEPLRVTVLLRDTDIPFDERFPSLASSLEASGGRYSRNNGGASSPGQSAKSNGSAPPSGSSTPLAGLKSSIRLTLFSDRKQASQEVISDGEIQLHQLGAKSTKLSWEQRPRVVLLVLKPGNAVVVRYADTVGRWLQSKAVEVVVEDDTGKELTQFSKLNELMAKRQVEDPALIVDFIVTLGGDGTVLHSSSLFKQSVPPVISFNLGSLGFLTRQQLPNFRSDLTALMEGDMFLVTRARLCARLLKNGPDGWFVAMEQQVMNEVVIDKGASSNLTNLDTYCDGVYVTTVQGDGVIVSTPTGSTAYSLACGGTMIHPSVPSIAFTPISPHSLSFRPVVFPARAELRITNSKLARAPAFVSFDGRCRTELSGDDVVSITTSEWPVPSVSSSDDISSWFSSLAECLHWNDRAAQNTPLVEWSNL